MPTRKKKQRPIMSLKTRYVSLGGGKRGRQSDERTKGENRKSGAGPKKATLLGRRFQGRKQGVFYGEGEKKNQKRTVKGTKFPTDPQTKRAAPLIQFKEEKCLGVILT